MEISSIMIVFFFSLSQIIRINLIIEKVKKPKQSPRLTGLFFSLFFLLSSSLLNKAFDLVTQNNSDEEEHYKNNDFL